MADDRDPNRRNPNQTGQQQTDHQTRHTRAPGQPAHDAAHSGHRTDHEGQAPAVAPEEAQRIAAAEKADRAEKAEEAKGREFVPPAISDSGSAIYSAVSSAFPKAEKVEVTRHGSKVEGQAGTYDVRVQLGGYAVAGKVPTNANTNAVNELVTRLGDDAARLAPH